MIPIKYTGAVLDTSGYASACRNYIGALLDTKEIDLTVGVKSFENEKTKHGKLIERIKPFINKPLDYKINIVHLTPENFTHCREKGKYNIGYTVWETDKLPDSWVHLCNTMNEIWVPSEWNVQLFKESGVQVPIYKIPHGISIPDLSDMEEISIAEDDIFVFYSIFQWIERKNPVALLKAYLTEFKLEEKVVLALKSYRISFALEEQEIIKKDIRGIKESLKLPTYPKVLFFGQLLPESHMKGFHNRGNCFVLPHHAEGFGIPHAEAMSFGKPVITTGYSGNLEFMNKDNSYLVNYQLTPVSGMIFPHYNGSMTWADPDIMDIRKHMRYVFENQVESKKVGEKGKQEIAENFSWEKVGLLMLNRIKEIHNRS